MKSEEAVQLARAWVEEQTQKVSLEDLLEQLANPESLGITEAKAKVAKYVVEQLIKHAELKADLKRQSENKPNLLGEE